MRLSEGVEWGLHCAVLLSFLPPDSTLSTGRMAEFNGVPTAYLAKHLQAMSRAGILEAVPGPRGGYRLSRVPSAISMLEVIEAIDGTESAFRCKEIRRRGPSALPASEYRLPCSIHVVMNRADEAWRAEVRSVSIADLGQMLGETAPPRALQKGALWFEEVLA